MGPWGHEHIDSPWAYQPLMVILMPPLSGTHLVHGTVHVYITKCVAVLHPVCTQMFTDCISMCAIGVPVQHWMSNITPENEAAQAMSIVRGWVPENVWSSWSADMKPMREYSVVNL